MGQCLCGHRPPPTMQRPFAEAAKQEPAANGDMFYNPIPLDDEATIGFAEQIRRELSQASEPVIKGFQQALVNTSVFGRERGRSLTRDNFRRLDSQIPKQGAPFLSWTQSRKLLEAAIAAEQQTIPEYRQPPNEWDSIASAEGRLRQRLHKFKLDMYVMEGDGNCQFRAVSFGLYGTQDYHGYVRKEAIKFMKLHKGDFAAFLGEDVSTYLREMSRDGVWGDELTLRAICNAFGVVINVITSDADNWFLRYLPQHMGAVKHEVFLTYISPVHYNAIRRSTSNRLDCHGSFSRKHSQILRAVNAFEQRQVLPDNPERLTELVGRV